MSKKWQNDVSEENFVRRSKKKVKKETIFSFAGIASLSWILHFYQIGVSEVVRFPKGSLDKDIFRESLFAAMSLALVCEL